MKKTVKTLVLLTLALALLAAQVALAEPDATVKGIYDALTAEGSGYSQMKAMYADYYPDCAFEEALNDDGFTLTISGSPEMEGSWTFARAGDNLTVTIGGEDMVGYSLIMYVMEAVGDVLGMDSALMNGYINGVNALGIEDACFNSVADGDGNTTVSINIAAPWEMKALDQMVLDERIMDFEPLGGMYTSHAASVGKVMIVVNGEPEDATILLGEYGGLDDVAYQSLINAVKLFRPNGWEDFIDGYTALADAETAGYTVRLNADAEAVAEIIDDARESYSYAVIHFGEQQ